MKELRRLNGKLIGTGNTINEIVEANKADLSYANLNGANLFRADLRGADLRGADLFRANLRGADLKNVKGYKIKIDTPIVKLLREM